MQPGFQNKTITTISGDGRNFILLEPLIYFSVSGKLLRAPAGAKTDGASAPRIAWREIPPFGDYWLAAIIHDAAYQDTLEICENEEWKKASLSKVESDNLIMEAMQSLGVGIVEREAIYLAVKEFGESSFDGDRSG